MTSSDTSPRTQAQANARVYLESRAKASSLGEDAFTVLAFQSSQGQVDARVPSKELPGMPKDRLSAALDELFEGQLVAWSTSKGWLHTRKPRNPATNRPLAGELFMTEKALREHAKDLYGVYFVANDYQDDDDRPRDWKNQTEWRATMATSVAPIPRPAAPAPTTRSPRKRR